MLALVFALVGANAVMQVVMVAIGRSDDPVALSALQSLVALAGGAAAIGSWRGSWWSPIAALCYGVVTACMLAALGPLLDLEPEARGGTLVGAAAVFLLGLGAGWYLRRVTRAPAG